MQFNFQIYQDTWQKLANCDRFTRPVPLQVFEIIPSTNIQIWELIDKGATTPLAAIALEQTAGKGQWGREWQSSWGGLYLSVGISLNLALVNNAHLVMCTAWGIATVLRTYALPVSLKWLNDLILDGRKLGGIKIETRTRQQQITQAVIGVGVNWTNPVPNLGINLKSYYQKSTVIKTIFSLEELTAIAIYGILFGYQYYSEVGINNFIDSYQAILATLGKKITFHGCPAEVIGVTNQGELKIRLKSLGATTEICLSPGQISLGYDF